MSCMQNTRPSDHQNLEGQYGLIEEHLTDSWSWCRLLSWISFNLRRVLELEARLKTISYFDKFCHNMIVHHGSWGTVHLSHHFVDIGVCISCELSAWPCNNWSEWGWVGLQGPLSPELCWHLVLGLDDIHHLRGRICLVHKVGTPKSATNWYCA